MAAFFNVACSSLFIWSMVWFSVYNLRSFVYDGNLRYMLIKYGTERDKGKQKNDHDIFGIFTLQMSLNSMK